MNKKLISAILLLPVLISSVSILGPFRIIPPVHALPFGVVCVADLAFNNCPSSAITFTGLPASKFVVAINIQNSSAINGFAISLHVDPTILKPLNATVDGSIVRGLPGEFFTANPANCVNNGVGFAAGTPGNIGCSGVDGNGTTTFAFLSVGGLSAQPITGRLFTAAYQVVGSTTGTPIGYVVTGTPTAAGTADCSNKSVANTCVTTSNGGTGGSVPESLAQTASFQTVNSDFVISTSASLTIQQSSSKTSTITATSIGGFSGTLALANSTVAGVTVTFNPTSVTVPSGGSAISTLKILVGNATQPATNHMLITATSGTRIHYLALNVTVQGFTFSATAPDVTIRGRNNTLNPVSITSTGFIGTITLSASVGNVTVPNRPAAAINSTVTFSQTPLVLKAFLNITTTLSTPIGNYTLTIIANSGNITQTVSFIFTIVKPDFSIAPAIGTVIVIPGSSNKTIVTATSLYTFSGTILLSSSGAPAGVTLSFNPTSVKVNDSLRILTATSNLTITVAGSTSSLDYMVNLTGTSGSLVHTVHLIVSVAKSGFNLQSTPPTLVVIVGKTNSSSLTLSRVGNFNGTVTLTPVSNNTLTANVTPNSAVLNSTRTTATSTLTVTSASSTSPGNYAVNITAAGVNANGVPISKVLTVKVIVVIPDFILSPAQATLVLKVGGSNSTTISLRGIYFFNGTVTLATSIINSTSNRPAASINPTVISLSKTSSTGSSTLSVNATPSTVTGNYVVVVTAQSGPLSHRITIIIIIPDFSITATPASTRIILGVNLSMATSNINITSIRALYGSISLTSNITPITTSGPRLQIVQTLSLPSSGSNTFLLNITATSSTAAQNYTITITAIAGAISHSTTIYLEIIRPTVQVQTPILQTGSGTTTLIAGQLVTVYVQVANPTKVNISITVALDAYNGIGNTNLTVVHRDLNLQPGDNLTVTLPWDTTSSTPGKYSVYVRVISSNMIVDQSRPVSSITLNAAPQNVGQLPGGNTLWIGIIVAAGLAIAGYFYYRRRKVSQTRKPLGT